MSTNRLKSNKTAWFAWLCVCFFWGTTLPGIRVAVRHIPPVLLSGFRVCAAGAVLLAVLLILRVPLPAKKGDWLGLGVAGGLLAIANGTLNIAAQYITSGPGTLFSVTAAFWIVIFEMFRPGGDSLTPAVLAGLGLGFLGVAVLFAGSGSGQGAAPVWAYGLMTISTFAWGLSSVLMRHRRLALHPFMSSAWQMIFAACLLIPLGYAMGERPAGPWPKEAWEAFAYLVLFGSLVGFVAFIYVVERLPAAVVGSYTYVNPLVAVWVGWYFLGEPVGRGFWAAGALVLAGIFLVQRDRAKKLLQSPDLG